MTNDNEWLYLAAIRAQTDELDRIKARIERIALDVETDQRSGKLKSKFSNGVDLARRLRAALSEP